MAKKKSITEKNISEESESNDITLSLDEMVGDVEEFVSEDTAFNEPELTLEVEEPELTLEDFKVDAELIELAKAKTLDEFIEIQSNVEVQETIVEDEVQETVIEDEVESLTQNTVEPSKSESISKILKDFEDSIKFQNLIKKDQIKSLFFNIKSKL